MAKYISCADFLDNLPSKCVTRDLYTLGYNTCLNSIKNLIETFPAANVVEVARCKDCKYRNAAPCPMRLSFNWTEDNDFCSYGEEGCGVNG